MGPSADVFGPIDDLLPSDGVRFLGFRKEGAELEGKQPVTEVVRCIKPFLSPGLHYSIARDGPLLVKVVVL